MPTRSLSDALLKADVTYKKCGRSNLPHFLLFFSFKQKALSKFCVEGVGIFSSLKDLKQLFVFGERQGDISVLYRMDKDIAFVCIYHTFTVGEKMKVGRLAEFS